MVLQSPTMWTIPVVVVVVVAVERQLLP